MFTRLPPFAIWMLRLYICVFVLYFRPVFWIRQNSKIRNTETETGVTESNILRIEYNLLFFNCKWTEKNRYEQCFTNLAAMRLPRRKMFGWSTTGSRLIKLCLLLPHPNTKKPSRLSWIRLSSKSLWLQSFFFSECRCSFFPKQGSCFCFALTVLISNRLGFRFKITIRNC